MKEVGTFVDCGINQAFLIKGTKLSYEIQPLEPIDL